MVAAEAAEGDDDRAALLDRLRSALVLRFAAIDRLTLQDLEPCLDELAPRWPDAVARIRAWGGRFGFDEPFALQEAFPLPPLRPSSAALQAFRRARRIERAIFTIGGYWSHEHETPRSRAIRRELERLTQGDGWSRDEVTEAMRAFDPGGDVQTDGSTLREYLREEGLLAELERDLPLEAWEHLDAWEANVATQDLDRAPLDALKPYLPPLYWRRWETLMGELPAELAFSAHLERCLRGRLGREALYARPVYVPDIEDGGPARVPNSLRSD